MASIRVLLVDDEERFLSTTKTLLEKRGVETFTATNGRDALAILEANRIDVVVLDVKMPGMDGREVLRRIKHDYALVEVVMLTGHATVDSAIEGMKLGAFDYLLKPVKFEDLLEKMAEAFRKKSTHDKKIRDAKIKELLRFPGRVFDQEKEKP